MSCSNPIEWEALVAYWAHDLSEAEVERVDAHLIGCAVCTQTSARVAAVVGAMRAAIPPVVTRALIEKLVGQGVSVRENVFLPHERKTVVFGPGVDLLIHRLSGLDLSNTRRVEVVVRSESTGAILLEHPNAPFDAREGVLIACQRHFEAFAADTVFELCAVEASGAEQRATYAIPHVFQRA
jgi:hypothetical protein